VVRGTATEPDVADLRPAALAVAAADHRADGVMTGGQITWCFAVQATMNSHAQLVLNTLLHKKPVIAVRKSFAK